MSSLTGIAQFTNQFAKNVMGYEDDKKKESERVADKQYDRNRQQQADVRTQQNHDVTLEDNQITLSQNKVKNKELTDATTYEQTRNQIAYLKGIGADEQQQVDVLSKAVNSNQKLPYTVEFERDQAGKIIQRQDENGKPFYFQTIIDKETGQELGRKGTTFEEAAGKAQRDHGYTVSLEGLKFGNTTQRDAVLHGFAIDKQNNQAGHTQSLAYIQGELAAGRIDQQTYNRMEEYLYKAGVDQGQTPGVTLGKDRASQVSGIIGSLTGTESSGNSGAFRTNTNGKSYGGLIQMGDDRLKDYATATGSRPISANQFKNLPAAQQRAANEWHINDLIGAAQATGAVGKVINGVPVTLGGLVAVAHLGGKGGMNKFVQTNGRYNPKDQLGTSLTDYLVKHRSSAAGGVQTTLTQPLAPKPPKGAGKNNQTPAQTVRTKRDYDVRIDKGVNVALKDVKSLGIKPDAATTATFARAGAKLKSMGTAQDNQEYLNLYQEAFELVLGAVPERDRKKMSKADQNALGHKVLLSITGASSLGELKQMTYNINPSARKDSNKSVSAGGLTLNLPGQQPNAPARQTPQTGKLQALSLRGLPAVKTDPKAQENIDYLGNLNDNIDW